MIMKIPVIKILFVCMLIFTFSCRSKYEDCTDQDYANCNTEIPQTGILSIRLTINEENPAVPISLYEGNFENGRLIRQDTVRVGRYNYSLLPDKNYSVTATYREAGKTIVAVSGGRINLIRYRMCELQCYDVDEPELDLRLR